MCFYLYSLCFYILDCVIIITLFKYGGLIRTLKYKLLSHVLYSILQGYTIITIFTRYKQLKTNLLFMSAV
jgi:hypothetical protein